MHKRSICLIACETVAVSLVPHVINEGSIKTDVAEQVDSGRGRFIHQKYIHNT